MTGSAALQHRILPHTFAQPQPAHGRGKPPDLGCQSLDQAELR